MLGKLLKKDFHATTRFFVPLVLGYAVLAILGKVLFEFMLKYENSFSQSNYFSTMVVIFYALFFFIFFVYFIVYYVLTYVFVVLDFYKTMTGSQAYLTHTLPVSTSQILFSKLLVSVVLQLILIISIVLSLILWDAGHFYIREFISNFRYAQFQFGFSIMALLFQSLLSMFMNLFYSSLIFYFCVAVGQLWKEHRIIGACLTYVAVHVITQILMLFLLFIWGIGSTFIQDSMNAMKHFSYLFYGISIFSLVSCIIFFVVTNYIFKNKLNLE